MISKSDPPTDQSMTVDIGGVRSTPGATVRAKDWTDPSSDRMAGGDPTAADAMVPARALWKPSRRSAPVGVAASHSSRFLPFVDARIIPSCRA